MRLITVPIAIYNQRNAGQMQIHMPKLQELQGKLQEARIRNDQLASTKLFSMNGLSSFFRDSSHASRR